MDPEKIADFIFHLPFRDRVQISTVLMLAALTLACCWIALTVDRLITPVEALKPPLQPAVNELNEEELDDEELPEPEPFGMWTTFRGRDGIDG